jgi:KUP system potassium uptake protein
MHTLWETCKLAFRSLGIVYGDLGTSPLYVYPSITCVDTPNEDDYLGILSLIFWTLTLIGIMKYTFIVLYVDDHGEGDNYCSQKYFVIHLLNLYINTRFFQCPFVLNCGALPFSHGW